MTGRETRWSFRVDFSLAAKCTIAQRVHPALSASSTSLHQRYTLGSRLINRISRLIPLKINPLEKMYINFEPQVQKEAKHGWERGRELPFLQSMLRFKVIRKPQLC